MIKHADFEKLQFGDHLAAVTREGNMEFYTYLARDPGWPEHYCFLMHSDGINVSHFYKGKVNNDFVTYDNIEEFEEYAKSVFIVYCRARLEELEKTAKEGGEK